MASTTTKSGAKKAPAKRSKRPASPVVLDGEPAKNRHFLLERVLVDAAAEKAIEDSLDGDYKISVSEVLRFGIREYGRSGGTIDVNTPDAMVHLPPRGLKVLKAVWDTAKRNGSSDTINQYLAALHRGGWTTRAIADSLVAAGCAEKMTRQAVSLRILKAPEELSPDLPPVPALGPRRMIVSSKKISKSREHVRDIAFRVKDSDYELAQIRAKSEGAMMSSVLDNVLLGYTNGEFDDRLDEIAKQ